MEYEKQKSINADIVGNTRDGLSESRRIEENYLHDSWKWSVLCCRNRVSQRFFGKSVAMTHPDDKLTSQF